MSCEKNPHGCYFDGTFHVIKYRKGTKVYTGTRFGKEFPVGETFYDPVDPDTPLPVGFMKALIDGNKPVSLTFSEFYNGELKTWWYSDPDTAKCKNCGIAAYILKRDAIFIDVGKDVLKFIQLKKSEKQRNFFEWLCSGVDKSYAGYTLGNELFLCNALMYLERDLTSEIDWQHVVNPEGTINRYLNQLKLYKTRDVNIFAGDLYDQTVWTLLHLEDIFSRSKVSSSKSSIIAAAAILSKIGFLGSGIQRQYDFILDGMNEKNVESFFLGYQDIPEFKIKGNKLEKEDSFSAETLLSELGVLKSKNTVMNIVKAHTLMSLMILNNKTPQRAKLYITEVKMLIGFSPDVYFMYYLLALSVASIKAMQPPLDPLKQSRYFPFMKNVPKKFRGGIVPDNKSIDQFVISVLETLPSHDDPGEMWYKNRILIGKEISQKIDDIEISQWKRCLSGDNSRDFSTKLGETVIIGNGTYGQVYLTSLKAYPKQKIVVKEALLEKDERTNMKPYTKNGFPDNSWPEEFKLLSMTKDILEKKKSPNFLNVYNLSACEGCDITTLSGRQTGTCYTTFMEAADGDLLGLDKKVLTQQNLQRSFVYQMMIALHIIQKEYGIVHRDIKKMNILYQRTPQLEGKFFKYIVNDREYLVENPGFVFYLADFGVATACKPRWAIGGDYGERNGMVHRSGDKVELKPLKSKYLYYDDGTRKPSPPLKWERGLSGTVNRVISGYDPEFNIPVDLSNTQVFPSWKFNGDIQDVMRTVVGGPHSVQKGNHRGFGKVSFDAIKPFITSKKYYDLVWKKDMAHQVLANEMMKKLYSKPSGDVKIIDTFII